MTPRTHASSRGRGRPRIALLASVVVTGCAASAAGQAARDRQPGPVAAHPRRPPRARRAELEYWSGRTDLIRAPAPPKPTELALPTVQRFTLKNGLDVIWFRARSCRSSPSASPCRRAATTRRAIRSASPTSWRRCSAAAPRRAAPTTSRAPSTSSAARWMRRRPARARPRRVRRCRRTPALSRPAVRHVAAPVLPGGRDG